jgi:hypothetical protein
MRRIYVSDIAHPINLEWSRGCVETIYLTHHSFRQSYYSTDFKPSFNIINQFNINNNIIFIILYYTIYNQNINIILKP